MAVVPWGKDWHIGSRQELQPLVKQAAHKIWEKRTAKGIEGTEESDWRIAEVYVLFNAPDTCMRVLGVDSETLSALAVLVQQKKNGSLG